MAIAQGNTSSVWLAATSNSISVNHAIADNPGRVLFVVVSALRGSGTFGVSSATFGGIAMTLVYDSGVIDSYRIFRVYKVVDPVVGTGSISVSFNQTVWTAMSAVDFYGLDLTTPISDSNSATGTSIGTGNMSITTTPADSSGLVLSLMGKVGSGETPTGNQSLVVNSVSTGGTATNNVWASIQKATGGTGVISRWDWTTTARRWVHVVLALSPAASGGRQFQAMWMN